MTKERAKELWPVMQAYAEGKTVQYFDEATTGGWKDCETEPSVGFPQAKFESHHVHRYRIKPTSTLRAWRPEEVPLGAWLKDLDTDFSHNPVSLILSVRGAWVHFMHPQTSKMVELTAGNLLSDKRWQYSTNRGKTWAKCGVEDSQ